MNIVKKTINYIKYFIKRKKTEKRAFYYAKSILKSGIYIVPHNKNEIISITKAPFGLRNLFHIHFNRLQRNSPATFERNSDYAEFNYGSGKLIILTDKYAYGFYTRNSVYSYAKNNFDTYYDKFNYPHISIYSFVDTLKCVVMQRTVGVSLYDYVYDKTIVNRLLELTTNAYSETNSLGKTYFLQHGDAKRANILWQGNSFTFVDLDGLHFLPPLFDVFHYLCGAGYDLKAILSLLNENLNLVNSICDKAKINKTNMFDNLFYEYVNYYVKQIGGYYGDFNFLTIENTKNYPKTNRLLKSVFCPSKEF